MPEAVPFGPLLLRGWLNLKTRSLVNVRPRHMRYCVLTHDKQLHTFKFQPSQEHLALGTIQPLRSYKVLGVAPWEGRRFAFLISVQSGGSDSVLEANATTEDAALEWLYHLRELTSEDDNGDTGSDDTQKTDAKAPLAVTRSKSASDMKVKGASVHRGLLNASGENSCFLNVIIQSFWHLTCMRHFLLHVEIKEDLHTVESNVLRALKSIMTEYENTSSGHAVHSRALRKGLSVLFKADKNFQEGAMYDAEETLLALLNLMHQQTEATEIEETQKTTEMVRSFVRLVSDDKGTDGSTFLDEEPPRAVYDENSIPHLVFSHQIYDRYVCDSCHTASPWDLYSNLVYTVYASDLYAESFESMEAMLRLNGGADVASKCDADTCEGKTNRERVIRRFPMVFALSILWGTNTATREQVDGVLRSIADQLDLASSFDAVGPVVRFRNGGVRTTYRLKGFVCYYGRHYVALFYSTAHQMWLLFDDNLVHEVGNWDQVVDKCLNGRFQPVLVFYELPDQRKDSSVGISLADMPPVSRNRNASASSSISDHLPPPTIEEEQAEEEVEEDDTRVRLESVEEEIESPTDGSIRLEADTETERNELPMLQQKYSQQDIRPVSSMIAMPPRSTAMTSTPKENEYDVHFTEDNIVLGICFHKIGGELCVSGFPNTSDGASFAAERSGRIEIGDLLVHANGHPLQHYTVDRAVNMIKVQTRPLTVRFRRSDRVRQLVDMGMEKERAARLLIECNGDVQRAAEKNSEANK